MPSDKLYGPAPANSIPTPAQAIAVTTEVPVLNPIPSPNPLLPGVVSLPLYVALPAGSILEKRAFGLLVTGAIVTAAAGNVTLKGYFIPSAIVNAGTSGTLGNNVAIGTSGAVAQASTGAPFVMRFSNCIYDSTSGKMTGQVAFTVNGVSVAAASFTAAVTGVSGQNDPVGAFMMTITLSGGAGSITVQDMSITF